MEEHLKVPSVREMLANINKLLSNGEIDTAINLGILASTQARISYALAQKAMADICIKRQNKGDRDAAKAYLAGAVDILCPEHVEEKVIQDNIKEQLSKLI